jgi:hypothetical protein
LISCACVLPSRLILLDLTFSLVPGPLLLLASIAFKVLLCEIDNGILSALYFLMTFKEVKRSKEKCVYRTFYINSCIYHF